MYKDVSSEKYIIFFSKNEEKFTFTIYDSYNPYNKWTNIKHESVDTWDNKRYIWKSIKEAKSYDKYKMIEELLLE